MFPRKPWFSGLVTEAMVTGMVTAEPWFSDWYARPRYATGTHEKAAFAGAEKLSKPDFQNLKKPETQDAAKPYIRWCTRA